MVLTMCGELESSEGALPCCCALRRHGDVAAAGCLKFAEPGIAVLFASAIASAAGNVVEMILSIAALLKGLYSVVAASLIGSILSNLLLVLGECGLFPYSPQSVASSLEMSSTMLPHLAPKTFHLASCLSLVSACGYLVLFPPTEAVPACQSIKCWLGKGCHCVLNH